MGSGRFSRVTLHQSGCSVSPSLWFESRDVTVMDDGSERDKEGEWWEAEFKYGRCTGTGRSRPALQLNMSHSKTETLLQSRATCGNSSWVEVGILKKTQKMTLKKLFCSSVIY